MKSKVIVPIFVIIVLLIIYITPDRDLVQLFTLHETNKIELSFESSNKTIEASRLGETLGHAFYKKKDLFIPYEEWDEVADLGFYKDEQQFLSGKLLRVEATQENLEAIEKASLKRKAYNGYIYQYEVKVGIFSNKAYYANVTTPLLDMIYE